MYSNPHDPVLKLRVCKFADISYTHRVSVRSATDLGSYLIGCTYLQVKSIHVYLIPKVLV